MLTDTVWPAIPPPHAALRLSLLHQLEQSQWQSPERLREQQDRQLQLLLQHARNTVPYYRKHLGASIERFTEQPVLKRSALQADPDAFKSERLPREHGNVAEVRTSGSTGSPIRVLKSQLLQLFWDAITLRDHLWHRRDLAQPLCAFRYGANQESNSWGSATAGAIATGPAASGSLSVDSESQLAWLRRHNPAYLISYPSNVMELAKTCLARQISLPGLREIRTMGETLSPEARRLCREAWDVPVVDMYSAEEVGYIALQCPEHEHYHVQAESLLVEILDEEGRSCPPGAIGRVVVTDLHNFAMPLIRYEIGDCAEVGEACSCGRGLAVLTRIAGRVRNMLVTRDGKRLFPFFGTRAMPEFDFIRQHQFVQRSVTLIEANLVVAAPLTGEQEKRVRAHILSHFPPGFDLQFRYRDSIPRSPSGKFEDFVSEVAAR